MEMALTNISIILVGTTHPGNIGATARAMKTMGLSRLVLAAPRCHIDDTAVAMAASADDVLGRALTVPDLATAVADWSLVVGTSARPRSVDWPSRSLRSAAPQLIAAGRNGPVAVVFGRERSGLTNEEMDRCNLLVRIPTAEELHSLNLAATVQVVAYELLQAATQAAGLNDSDRPDPKRPDDEPASAAESERLFEHLDATLRQIGFLQPTRAGVVMRRLRSMVHRMRPSRREVRMLRGIFAASEGYERASTNDENRQREEHV